MRLVALSIFGLLACGTEPVTHVEDLPGARNEAYRAASAHYGVDQDWLVAIGFQQGRFESAQQTDTSDTMDTSSDALTADTPVDEPDDSTPDLTSDPLDEAAALPSWGLMYLTDVQIDRAATLTGHSPDLLRGDVTANIDGAAAILAEDAHAMGSLRAATTAFLGVEDDAATLALDELDTAIATGFDVTTTNAERLALDGTGANIIADPISPDEETADADRTAAGHTPPYQWIASPNFSTREGYPIRYVVIHDIEGTMAGAIAVFKSSANQTSAHYIVRSHDGHIVKMVLERNNAWHAGHAWFNRHSIGIEHEGFAHRRAGGGYYTDTLYGASAALTCAIVHRYNIPVDRKHIFGHENVPSNLSSHTLCSDARGIAGLCGGVSHHSDPGKYWDWKKYMKLVSSCVARI